MIYARSLSKIFRTYKKEKGLWGAIRGLGRREYEETRAVDNVSFTIEQGEFVGFLGPNGAGKTTVLKIMSGLLNPSSGEAEVLGYVPWHRRPEMKRQFSLLMGQKNSLWWDLPARESLELNRAIYGIDQDAFNELVGELGDMLDVTRKMNVMVRELSLGERMKMELISALLHRPKVLFLDEPTIGLDVMSQKKVREFLYYYNSQHRIITMLTSHYMRDIEELCRRVILIDHGRIFFDGALDDMVEKFASSRVINVQLGESPRDLSDSLGRIVEKTDYSLRIEVPRARVAEVCREIFARQMVTDLSVEDIPVEEVIRHVFEENQTR